MIGVRVVGPPGSGKTLLITALTEALRQRGQRTASAVQRAPEHGSSGGTVLTLGSGARVTVDRLLDLPAARDLAAALDPAAVLLLAEGFAGETDGAFPVLFVHGLAPTMDTPTGANVIATVDGTDLARRFPAEGATAVAPVADAVEAYLRHTHG